MTVDLARPHSFDLRVQHGDTILRARVLLGVAGLYRPALHLPVQRALWQPRFKGWCPCASSTAGEHKANPLPEAPTSHGAPARLTRHSQAAVASDSSRAVTLMQPLNELLIFDGLAAPHDDPRHPERLLSGHVMRPDRAVEAVAWPWREGGRRRALGRPDVRAGRSPVHVRMLETSEIYRD